MGIFDSIRRWRAALRSRDAVSRAHESPKPAIEMSSHAQSTDATAATERRVAEQPVIEADYHGPERRNKNRVNARPGTRILIVDDSTTIVALLRKMLQQNSYEILEAYTAEDAIEILQRERLDLIFLDIVLPGMDGFAALRALRRDPNTKSIPVIMISGNTQATEQFYVQRIGADDFMKKPFSRAEVFVRIERLLDADLVPRRSIPPSVSAIATD